MSDLQEQQKWNTQYHELKDLTITQVTVQIKHLLCSCLSCALFADTQNNNVDNPNEIYNNYRFLTQKNTYRLETRRGWTSNECVFIRRLPNKFETVTLDVLWSSESAAVVS